MSWTQILASECPAPWRAAALRCLMRHPLGVKGRGELNVASLAKRNRQCGVSGNGHSSARSADHGQEVVLRCELARKHVLVAGAGVAPTDSTRHAQYRSTPPSACARRLRAMRERGEVVSGKDEEIHRGETADGRVRGTFAVSADRKNEREDRGRDGSDRHWSRDHYRNVLHRSSLHRDRAAARRNGRSARQSGGGAIRAPAESDQNPANPCGLL
jgi:hypothetical protein